MHRQIVATAVVAAFLALDVAGAAGASPAAPDPTYPTGSFTIPQPTEYVLSNGFDYESSQVPLVVSSLSDDTTPADEIVVRIYAGTTLGRSADGEVLPAGSPEPRVRFGGGLDEDPYPYFKLAGTYHPYVTLTDKDDNTTRIDLPTVTLLEDRTAPVTRLTLPRKNRRDTKMAWRYIRGTIRDAGIDRPGSYNSYGAYADVALLQKRHGLWYLYECYSPDPSKHRTWCKGRSTVAATLKKFPSAGNSARSVGGTRWRTAYTKGLTRGPLVVAIQGSDCNFNSTPLRIAARTTITRWR